LQNITFTFLQFPVLLDSLHIAGVAGWDLLLLFSSYPRITCFCCIKHWSIKSV